MDTLNKVASTLNKVASTTGALLALSLVVFTTQPAHADPGSACNSEKAIALFEKNFPPSGFTITKSGDYCLKQDIDWAPNDGASAISINGIGNVNIDLSEHRISQVCKTGVCNIANTIGIKIVGSVGITITNGTIENMTGLGGINIHSSSDIDISKIKVKNTGEPNAFGGIQFYESNNIRVDNVHASKNFGTGLHLSGVTNAKITNSSFNGQVGGNLAPQFFFSPGQTAWGAGVSSSPTTTTSNIWFENCSFNNNVGGGDAGGLEIGPWSLLPVTDITVIKCEFLDNAIGGDDTLFNDASGFVLVHVDRFLVKDSVSSGQKHPFPPGSTSIFAVSGATGFSINDGNNGVLENCIANNNTGKGNTSIGMRIRSSTNVVVKNCQASNNTNLGNGAAFGFYTDVDDLPMFGWPSIGRAIVFDRCTAQGNTSTMGLSGGFKISNLIDSVISNNGNNASQGNGHGILVTDSNTPQIAGNNIFENNILRGNTISGITNLVPGANDVYTKNISVLNGPLSTTNFVSLPANTPISIWDLSDDGPLFPLTTTGTNLDVIP